MLRALVAALLIANLAFFGWSQGWLDDLVGTRSIGDREPERLARQQHPELVRILAPAAASDAAPAAPAASSPAPPPAPLACLEAGPFADAALAVAQKAAHEALPAAVLTVARTTKPGSWIIYMGRYANREALLKKTEELNRRRVSYDEVRNNAALSPGLSLGHFDDRVAATRMLEQLGTQQNIHTARIIEFAPASTSQMLRIEQADPALLAQATGLKLAALGKGFVDCVKP